MAGKGDDNIPVEQASRIRRPVRPPADESDIDLNFVLSASYGDLRQVKLLIDKGANVNFREPTTGATALHFAAALKAREMINWLVKQDGIDFLIKDKDGRLPSALAFEAADDPAIGRFLARKQAEQARERGIDLKTLIGS